MTATNCHASLAHRSRAPNAPNVRQLALTGFSTA